MHGADALNPRLPRRQQQQQLAAVCVYIKEAHGGATFFFPVSQLFMNARPRRGVEKSDTSYSKIDVRARALVRPWICIYARPRDGAVIVLCRLCERYLRTRRAQTVLEICVVK